MPSCPDEPGFARDTAGVQPSRTDAEAWLDDHGSALFAFAQARTGDADAAADLVQETLLAAWRGRDRFEGRSSVRTWLTGILLRKTQQWHRDRARPGARAVELGPELADDAFGRGGKWRRGPRSWWRGETDELAAALQTCISQLPERTADAFLLRERFDLDMDATSRMLDVTTDHLYTILYRARMALRSCIERRARGDSA